MNKLRFLYVAILISAACLLNSCSNNIDGIMHEEKLDSVVHTIPISDSSNIYVLERENRFYLADDILLSNAQFALLKQLGEGTKQRSAVMTEIVKHWPDGIVPYEIEPGFVKPSRITDAILDYHNNTPIRLVPKTNAHRDYVIFRNSTDGTSNSLLGRKGGGRQDINILNSASTGTVIHEIGHAIGLFHEHTRADRDNFVWVNPAVSNNINYQKYDSRFIGYDVGVFDFGSIMMYPPNNDLRRINNGSDWFTNRVSLSGGDIIGINYIYGFQPYVRMRQEITEDWSYGGITEEREHYQFDIYVDFFQDPQRTIPYTLPHDIRLYYDFLINGYVQSLNGTVDAKTGNTSVLVGWGFTTERRYEYGNLVSSHVEGIQIHRNKRGYRVD